MISSNREGSAAYLVDGATTASTSVGNEDVKSAKLSSGLIDGLRASFRVGLREEDQSMVSAKIAFETYDIELVGFSLDVVLLGEFLGLFVTRVAVVCVLKGWVSSVDARWNEAYRT